MLFGSDKCNKNENCKKKKNIYQRKKKNNVKYNWSQSNFNLIMILKKKLKIETRNLKSRRKLVSK